jgi:hypothetical protein
MAPGAGLRLFIVHAPADAWFVEGFLLEALHLSEREVLVSSKLELGAVVVNEIERGALSPVTVVVVSPAFLACAISPRPPHRHEPPRRRRWGGRRACGPTLARPRGFGPSMLARHLRVID